MLRGLQIAAAGMQMEQARAEVGSHNLANAATPGYRRQVAVAGDFRDVLLQRLGDPADQGRDPAVGRLSFGPLLVATAADTRTDPLPDGSNVDAAREMTDLLVALRTYTVNQRSLQIQDATLARALELGKV